MLGIKFKIKTNNFWNMLTCWSMNLTKAYHISHLKSKRLWVLKNASTFYHKHDNWKTWWWNATALPLWIFSCCKGLFRGAGLKILLLELCDMQTMNYSELGFKWLVFSWYLEDYWTSNWRVPEKTGHLIPNQLKLNN